MIKLLILKMQSDSIRKRQCRKNRHRPPWGQVATALAILLLAITTTAQATNLLTGSSVSVDGVDLLISESYMLFDDETFLESDIYQFYAQCTEQDYSHSIIITPSSAISVASLIVLGVQWNFQDNAYLGSYWSLSYTESDGTITTTTMSNYEYGTITFDAIKTIESIELTSTNDYVTHKVCIDKIFANSEFSLRSSIQYIDAYWQDSYGNWQGVMSTDEYGLKVDDITLSPWYDLYTPDSSIRIVADDVALIFGQIDIGFWDGTDMQSGSVLITSVYVEPGLFQNVEIYLWANLIVPSSVVDTDGNLLYEDSTWIFEYVDAAGRTQLTDGTFVAHMTRVQVVNEAYLATVQFFGFTYFTAYIDNNTDVTVYIPTGMGETNEVATVVTYSYTIGDGTYTSDDFVLSGIFVKVNYASTSDPTVTLLVSGDELLFTITADSTWKNFAGQDILVTIHVYDRRSPTLYDTILLTFAYRPACLEVDVMNAWNDFSSYYEEYDITSGDESSVAYTMYDEPGDFCIGLYKAIYWAVLTFDGVEYDGLTSIDGTSYYRVMSSYYQEYDQYVACKAEGLYSCFYNDEDNHILYWQFDDDSYYGTLLVGIRTQYEYYLGINDYSTGLWSSSTQIVDLTIKSDIPCYDTTFNDAVATYSQYSNFATSTLSDRGWDSTIKLDTTYLAYNAVTSTTDIALSIVFSVDDIYNECPSYARTFVMTQETTDTVATTFQTNGFLQLSTTDNLEARIDLSSVTASTYTSISGVLFYIKTYYTHIHNIGMSSEPSQTSSFSLTVGSCVPYSSTLTYLSSGVSTDLEGSTQTYYREQTTMELYVTITLTPACDDTTGVATLTYTYSLNEVSLATKNIATITMNQPKTTDVDSTQSVTLNYVLGSHTATKTFSVFYNGCGISKINSQSIAAIAANVGTTSSVAIMTFTDSVSLLNGNKDGYTYCGNRNYTINSLNADAYPFMTIASNNITILATEADLGFYSVPINVTLQDYSAVVTLTVYVSVKIEEATVESTICLFSNVGQTFDYAVAYVLGSGSYDIDISVFWGLSDLCTEKNIEDQIVTQYDSDSLGGKGYTFEYPLLTIELSEGDIKEMPDYAQLQPTFIIKNTTLETVYSANVAVTLVIEEDSDTTSDEDDGTTEEETEISEASFTLLEEWPPDAETIECVGTSSANQWEYQLPALVNTHDSVTYWNIVMNHMLDFDADSGILTVISSTKSAPDSGDYVGTFTVISGSYKEVYSVEFTYYCDAELSEEDLTPPIPKVEKARSDGVILITWDKEMKLPEQKKIAEGQITQNKAEGRLLAEETISMRFNQGSNVEQIDPAIVGSFKWQMEWVNTKETEISLVFDHPEFVSAMSGPKDSIEVTIMDTSYFKSSKDIAVPLDHLTLTIPLPKQYSKNSVTVDVSGVAAAGSVALGTTLVFSFILKAVLNQLLGVVDSISLITHMFLLSLNYPVNVQDFFGQIFPLIAFDLIPFDTINDEVFAFHEVKDDEPMTEQFDAVGYGTSLIVLALGDMYYLIFLSPLIVAILLALRSYLNACCCGCFKCVRWLRNYVNYQIEGYFWSGTFQFIYSGYLIMSICVMIGLKNLKFGGDYLWQNQFCSGTTIFMAVVVFCFPFVLVVVYWCKIKTSNILPDLEDFMQLEELRQHYGTIDVEKIKKNAYTKSKHKAFKEKYGTLIQGMNLRKHGKALIILFPFWNMMRKLLLAVAILEFLTTPQFAIMAFNFGSLFTIMLELYVMPLKDQRAQKISVFNEITTLVINYHLFCMTEFTDISVRSYVGNSIIYVTCANIGFNFSVILIPILNQKFKVCKRNHRHRAHKKLQKKLMKAGLVKPENITVEVDSKPVTIEGQTVTEMTNVTQTNVKVMHHNNKRRKIIVGDDQVDLSMEILDHDKSLQELAVEDFNTSVEMREVQGKRESSQNLTSMQLGIQNLRRKNMELRDKWYAQAVHGIVLNSIEESKEDQDEDSIQQVDEKPLDDSKMFLQSFNSQNAPQFSVLNHRRDVSFRNHQLDQ